MEPGGGIGEANREDTAAGWQGAAAAATVLAGVGVAGRSRKKIKPQTAKLLSLSSIVLCNIIISMCAHLQA